YRIRKCGAARRQILSQQRAQSTQGSHRARGKPVDQCLLGWRRLEKTSVLQKAYEIGFTLAQAFVREEEKCLVFLDGASEGETRLKPPKWGIDRRSVRAECEWVAGIQLDRRSTRLNSSHEWRSYAVFC